MAIELMRRAGQTLDPWQQDAITTMLGVREDGKWACFEYAEWVSRQNGKGAILEARALAGLFLLGEKLILWSAHEYKTAMEAFRRVRILLKRLGREVNENLYVVDGLRIKVIESHGKEGFEFLDTGQRLQFIARSKGSGRGFTGDVNIIDEALLFDLIQQSALMPTVSAVENPQFVYTSSPPLTGTSGDVMFKLRYRGDPTLPREDDDPPWSQDDSLGYRDWGMAGDLDHLDQVDLDDPANHAATNPALEIRITAETVRRERRSMDAVGFARERCGIWPFRPSVANARWLVIPEADWTDALDPGSQMGKRIALAVSVSWDRGRASICAAGPRADGLLHGETVENKAGTGWVVRRLKELVDKWSPVAVVVNPGGPAGSLIPDIEAAGITVKQATSRETAQAYGAFYDAVCGKPYLEQDADGNSVLIDPRKFRHVGDEELTDAVAVGQTRPLGGGHAWDLKDADGDLTPVDGVTLALLGVATHEEEPVNPPATAPSAPTGGGNNLYRPTSRLKI